MAPDPWRPLPDAATSPFEQARDWLHKVRGRAPARAPGDRVRSLVSAALQDFLHGGRPAAGLGIAPQAAIIPASRPRRRDSFSLHRTTLDVKTYVAKPSDRQRDWLLVDARGQTLGRLATQIADHLRGKRKPEYTPHIDTGDFVVVVNAEQIHVTGDKRTAKLYHRHSGYPGGLRSRTLAEMLERRPEEVIRLAVKGMLPRNRLARQQLRKLKVYAGPDHPHEAQQPRAVEEARA
jgi:large subunit ribosomal protein L13